MSLLNRKLVIEDGIVRRIDGTGAQYTDKHMAAIQQLFDDGTFSQDQSPTFTSALLGSMLSGLMRAVVDGELVYRPIYCGDGDYAQFGSRAARLVLLEGVLFRVGLTDGRWMLEVLDDNPYTRTLPTYGRDLSYAIASDGRAFIISAENGILRREINRGAEFDDLLCNFGVIAVSRSGGIVRISIRTEVIIDIPLCVEHYQATRDGLILLADVFQLFGYDARSMECPLIWSRNCEVAQIRESTVLMKDGTIWYADIYGLSEIDAIKPLAPRSARKPALFPHVWEKLMRRLPQNESSQLALSN